MYVEYHAKSGASSLKIERVMLNLVFGAFLMFLRFVYMEYHAKSEASSLKIEQVMLNLVFGVFLTVLHVFDIFAFLRFCVLCIWSTMQNLELLA